MHHPLNHPPPQPTVGGGSCSSCPMGKYNTARGKAACMFCEVGRFGKQQVNAPSMGVQSVNVETAFGGGQATTMRVCANCPAGTLPGTWMHAVIQLISTAFYVRKVPERPRAASLCSLQVPYSIHYALYSYTICRCRTCSCRIARITSLTPYTYIHILQPWEHHVHCEGDQCSGVQDELPSGHLLCQQPRLRHARSGGGGGVRAVCGRAVPAVARDAKVLHMQSRHLSIRDRKS
jgi:hypothetical protein